MDTDAHFKITRLRAAMCELVAAMLVMSEFVANAEYLGPEHHDMVEAKMARAMADLGVHANEEDKEDVRKDLHSDAVAPPVSLEMFASLRHARISRDAWRDLHRRVERVLAGFDSAA